MDVGLTHVVNADRDWTGSRLEEEEEVVGILLEGEQVFVVVDGGGHSGDR